MIKYTNYSNGLKGRLTRVDYDSNAFYREDRVFAQKECNVEFFGNLVVVVEFVGGDSSTYDNVGEVHWNFDSLFSEASWHRPQVAIECPDLGWGTNIYTDDVAKMTIMEA